MSRVRVVVLVICALWGARAHAAGLRRFALVAGNDEGGPGTRPLEYATADARKMHDIFTQQGGVNPDDARLLLDGDSTALWTALDALERRAQNARAHGERSALLFYYSGHAKDGELRLGGSRVPIAALKDRLARGGAGFDVRIGIFDSCRSGDLSRSKGARRAPAFDVQADDGAQDARGYVLLTSSTGDEDSQESDLIRGSYFTHHLAAALRGAADRTLDDKITLSEAYVYAYAQTVAQTTDTFAGAQHPTFVYDLKGSGDFVLADNARRNEGVLLPATAPAGIYYFVREGFIVAEVDKPEGAPRRLALAAERYQVKRRLPDRLRVGQLRIASNQIVVLDESQLRDAPFSDDPVKGAARGPRLGLSLGASAQSFFDAPTRAGLFPPTGLLSFELDVRDFFRRGWGFGFDAAIGGAHGEAETATVTAPFRFTELAAGATLFAEMDLFDGRVQPFLGGRVAWLFLSRTFEDDVASLPAQRFSTFSPGLVAGARLRLGGGLHLAARARLHYLLYNVDENRSLGYWELALALGWQL